MLIFKDCMGQELHVGDVVVYSRLQGRTAYPTIGVVTMISGDFIRVKIDTKSMPLTNRLVSKDGSIKIEKVYKIVNPTEKELSITDEFLKKVNK